MSNSFEFDTTVKRGMPVTACGQIAAPEPDVGISGEWVEDIWLEVRGRRATWLEDRLDEADWANLYEEALLLQE